MEPINETTKCMRVWATIHCSASGEATACCSSHLGTRAHREDGSVITVKDDDFADCLRSITISNMRKEMMAGKWPEACFICAEKERVGLNSQRIRSNDILYRGEILTEEPLPLRNMELWLGNLCNLTCKMCSPKFSTAWRREYRKIPEIRSFGLAETESVGDFSVEKLEPVFRSIENLTVAGGEPLLIPKFYELIDYLVDRDLAKGLNLSINTNLTTLPDKFIDRIHHMKNVRVNVSMDGYGKLNDYIRYGSVWAETDEYFRKLITLTKIMPNLQLGVITATSMYNVLHLPALIDYIRSTGFSGFHNVSLVMAPSFMDIRGLPPELKKLAASRLEPYRSMFRVGGTIDYMLSEDWSSQHWNTFVEYSKLVDQRTSIKLDDVVPEMSRWL